MYFAKQDTLVKKMYQDSFCLVPDGKSLELVAKIKGHHLPQIRGPWVFRELLNRGRNKGIKHFLLGTTDETLEKLETKLVSEYPGVKIVGKYSPPFGVPTDSELAAQDKIIQEAGPDVIWLGVSSPKQDFEAQRLAKKFSVMTLAVGAAFDFVAGTQKEAPLFMQKIGAEWLYRLLSNPKRLWKRYLIGNFVFLVEAFKRGGLSTYRKEKVVCSVFCKSEFSGHCRQSENQEHPTFLNHGNFNKAHDEKPCQN